MTYKLYKEKLEEISDINNSIAVLQWDQEVNMPKKGHEFRAQQIATLSVISHQKMNDDSLEEIVNNLCNDSNLSKEQKRNVDITKKDIAQSKKLSSSFISKKSKCISASLEKWQQARKNNEFSTFAPALKELISISKEEAHLLGYQEHPYDALLNLYEPEMTVSKLDAIFAPIKKEIPQILQKIQSCSPLSEAAILQEYDPKKQFELSVEILKEIGYDFEAGRQDISSHPFSTSFNPNDSRITTRINKGNVADTLSSTIHEVGHALYEQGILTTNYGLPAGSSLSLGIHESQSRLWENNIGRSRLFWDKNFPLIQKAFPKETETFTSEDFFLAINAVKPSLIRTESDEISYHMHVLIRYEIEKHIFSTPDLDVNELPELWNAKYKEYLGVDVPSDSEGILQDIHWSHGSFGYFPTYSLGSFYAVQFFNSAKVELNDFDKAIANNEFTPLIKWLNTKIHQHGRLIPSEDLCQKVTGEKLNTCHFIDYIKDKYSKIYNTTL